MLRFETALQKTLFKRDQRFWYHFVSHLIEYTCAKNCQEELGVTKLLRK